MLRTLAQILARHATDVIGRVTGDRADGLRISDRFSGRPVYELATVIDFEGRLSSAEKQEAIGGYMLCGALKISEVQPFLEAVAAHLGLEMEILKTADGPLNILSEFLNIVIGLTAAEWAERGFEMNFSPPRVLNSQPPPAPTPGDRTFHIAAPGPALLQADIAVVFNEKPNA